MVYKLNRRPSRKAKLVSIAAAVVAEEGFEALTIERLAQRAGVTKGGVQYHFETKDALIREVLETLLAGFDQVLDAYSAQTPAPGGWLRAYVEAAFNGPGTGDRAAIAILAALPLDHPATAPFTEHAARCRARAAADGIDPAIAAIVRLAADAVWLERVTGAGHGLGPIKARLLRLLEDHPA